MGLGFVFQLNFRSASIWHRHIHCMAYVYAVVIFWLETIKIIKSEFHQCHFIILSFIGIKQIHQFEKITFH